MGVQYGLGRMSGDLKSMGGASVGFSIPLYAGRRQMKARDEAAAMESVARARFDQTLAMVDALGGLRGCLVDGVAVMTIPSRLLRPGTNCLYEHPTECRSDYDAYIEASHRAHHALELRLGEEERFQRNRQLYTPERIRPRLDELEWWHAWVHWFGDECDRCPRHQDCMTPDDNFWWTDCRHDLGWVDSAWVRSDGARHSLAAMDDALGAWGKDWRL